MKRNFFIPEHKKILDDYQAILNEEYLITYNYLDGFTGRLLRIDLLIDRDLKAEVFHKSFALGNYRIEDFDGFNFYESYKDLPKEIYSFLNQIIGLAALDLKELYGDVVDDGPASHYLFNVGGSTKMVSLYFFHPLEKENFQSDLEKEFFKFHSFVYNWTMGMYERYVKEFVPQ